MSHMKLCFSCDTGRKGKITMKAKISIEKDDMGYIGMLDIPEIDHIETYSGNTRKEVLEHLKNRKNDLIGEGPINGISPDYMIGIP